MRQFVMVRDTDVSGISGTGEMADGCIFPDGTTVIRWRGEHRSTAVWDSLESAIIIHGHDGKTRFVDVREVDPCLCHNPVEMSEPQS